MGAFEVASNSRQIVRNLIVLKSGEVLAGYRIGFSRWEYQSQGRQQHLISRSADVWAALGNRKVFERVSTRPHPVQAWARALDGRTAGRELPDVHTCGETAPRGDLLRGLCGCETWAKHLVRMQNRIAAGGMDNKVVFRWFSVGKATPKTDVRRLVLDWLAGNPVSPKIADVVAEERRVHDMVKGWPGSRRMSEREQAWARLRSMAPGVQPGHISAGGNLGWSDLELSALANDIRWQEEPFGRTVATHAWVDGKKFSSAARVLTVSRLTDLAYPENGLAPWQVVSESARDSDGRAFPVDWAISGRLIGGPEMISDAEFELKSALYAQRDYQDFNEIVPSSVELAIRTAKQTRDQVTDGQAAQANRFLGQINVIISARDAVDEQGKVTASAADVVEARCANFIRLYSGAGLRMDFTGPQDQAYMLRSTIPGEVVDRVGYQHRLGMDYLASGMPEVTNTVGDNVGPYIGMTRGASRSSVMHDSHFATEGRGVLGRGQSFYPIVGTLGSGKTCLQGAVAYSLVRRGVKTILLDPSGPMARLAEMPELAPFSQVVNLLSSKRGTLSPPALIREPRPDEFTEPGQWAEAVNRAEAERRDLLVDMARRCCQADLYDNPQTRTVLREATRAFADAGGRWSMASTMWDLIDHLPDTAHGREVRGALVEASTAPLLSLMFPERDEAMITTQYNSTLTIITTPGIRRASDGVGREHWNPAEMGADVVLRLVFLFTERLIYMKDRNERAAVFFDEAESFTDSGPGRALLSRLGRDHSKWNTAVYLLFKTVGPEMMNSELRNFIGGAWLGRMASAESAVEALQMVGLPAHHAPTLTGLSEYVPGEFLHVDVEGRVGGMRVDLDYHPALRDALLTTPVTEGISSDWTLEEEELV